MWFEYNPPEDESIDKQSRYEDAYPVWHNPFITLYLANLPLKQESLIIPPNLFPPASYNINYLSSSGLIAPSEKPHDP